MTIQNFQELRDRLKKTGKKPIIAIAAAEALEIMELVRELRSQKLAQAILVGNTSRLGALCAEADLNPLPELVAAEGEAQAAQTAVALVRQGHAHVLMKGMINSSIFLKAILDPEQEVRGGSLLSHLAAFEIPGQNRLHFHTDGGMNLSPDLEQKRAILANAVQALHRLGYTCPLVAALAANEIVNPKLPSTVDAAELQRLNWAGEIKNCLIEGPIAMDVAMSAEAAVHKHIESQVSGAADIFLMPNIEAGNLVGKTLMYAAHAKMAGVILGATCPIVMVSRADNAEAKLNSLALACAAI